MDQNKLKLCFTFLTFFLLLVFFSSCAILEEENKEEDKDQQLVVNENVFFLLGDSVGFGINYDYLNTNTNSATANLVNVFSNGLGIRSERTITEEEIANIDLNALFNVANFITAHTNAVYTNARGYVEDLTADTSYQVVNFSIPGFTVRNIYRVLKKLVPKFMKNMDLVKSKLGLSSVVPGAVIVQAGGNDLLGLLAAGNISLTTGADLKNSIKAELQNIITDAKKINPSIKLYLVNAYDPLDGISTQLAAANTPLVTNIIQKHLSGVNSAFQSVALGAFSGIITTMNQAYSEIATANENVYLVDIYSTFLGKGFTSTNSSYFLRYQDIHPNSAGYQAIAQKLKTVIAESRR